MSNSLALWEMKASSFEEAQKIATLVSNSSLCPSAYRSGPAGDKSGDVILASAYGATLGMSLMQSLSNISVINGHATVWGDALPAICRRSGKARYIKEDFDPETMTATCTAARTDEPEDITHSASFSIEDARRANLVSIDDKGNINSSKGPWKQYPRRMLQMRARAYCLRDTFPDALQGIEVTEEVRTTLPSLPAIPAAPTSSASALTRRRRLTTSTPLAPPSSPHAFRRRRSHSCARRGRSAATQSKTKTSKTPPSTSNTK